MASHEVRHLHVRLLISLSGNVNQVADMKIGILSSYANNKDFRDWCSTHGISPAIQEYENISFDIGVALEDLGNGQYLYTLTPSQAYLQDENTVYPVKIDPSVNIAGEYIYEFTHGHTYLFCCCCCC